MLALFSLCLSCKFEKYVEINGEFNRTSDILNNATVTGYFLFCKDDVLGF